MPRPLRMEFEHALYHVTSRGNARQVLFHTDSDRIRFLGQLRDNLETYGVVLYAWVLMDNHFHLVLRTPRANLSRFMQRLNSSYSLYYRYKHGKSGHVMGGRFKAPVIQDDTYLLSVTRYVHLNPVQTQRQQQRTAKERMAFLNAYPWSSFPNYVRNTPFPDWMSNYVLKAYGRNLKEARKRYRSLVLSGMTRQKEAAQDLMKSSPYAIGSADFVDRTTRELSRRATGGPQDRDISLPRTGMALNEIDRVVSQYFGVSPAELQQHGRTAGPAKIVALELAARWSGKTLRAIGQYYGQISSQAVTMARKRAKQIQKVEWDKLGRELEAAQQTLK